MGVIDSGLKIMHKSGLNTYLNVEMGLDAAHEFSNSALTLADGTWNEDPNTFTQAGMQFGYGAGSLASLGVFGAMGAGFAIQNKVYNTFKYENNLYKEFKPLFKESYIASVNGAAVEEELQRKILGSGVRGRMAGGAFKAIPKHLGKAIGIGGTLAMFAASIATPIIGGAAGKVVDSAWQSSISARQIKYDNRFFNTQEQEMSAYQTLGASMDAYRSRMISCARVYHHSG